MKEYFKIVVVVLVYKNTEDLKDFIRSFIINGIECKTIVVNSFFDEESNNQFKLIAEKYQCDFMQVENKGYGAGNNRGIEYLKNKYDFDFLIISNPDIEIISFNQLSLEKYSDGVIGPIIKNMNSNNKNPYWYLHIPIFEWFMYLGAKFNKKWLFYLGIIFNKCFRIYFQFMIKIFKRDKYRVFALQGAFLIFHKNCLCKLYRVFDEDMFLFSEEAHLAHLAKNKNIQMFFEPEISIFHKQGGSSTSILKKEWQYQQQSITTYYQKWYNYDKW